MKRILSTALSFITAATVFTSCDKIEDKKPSVDEPSIVMWTEHSYDKIRVEMKAPKEPETQYTVYLAKNETESVNIAIRSDSDTGFLQFVTLKGDDPHIETETFHIMKSETIKRKQWTDPAAPLGPGKRFKLKANETMAVLIDFKTTADTPAGEYAYEFGITDKSGKTHNKVSITVHVWDFEMSEERKFQTAVGNKYTVEHYELLLEHNLCGYDIPYDLLDPRADAYMSDPRVTSFRIPFYNGDTDYEEKL